MKRLTVQDFEKLKMIEQDRTFHAYKNLSFPHPFCTRKVLRLFEMLLQNHQNLVQTLLLQIHKDLHQSNPLADIGANSFAELLDG